MFTLNLSEMLILLLSELCLADQANLVAEMDGIQLKMCHSDQGVMIGECEESGNFAEVDQKENVGKNLIVNDTIAIQGFQIPITSISKNAFHGSQLNSIYLPSTITRIGSQAFKKSELQNIFIADTIISAVTEEMLCECTKLKEITLPNTVSTLEKACFANSTIKQIIFRSKISTIPSNCFFGCTQLSCITYYTEICAGIDLYDIGVLSIDASAFSGCENAKNIRFGRELTISEKSFHSTGITLLDFRTTKLEKIPQSAFESCTSLTQVWLSNQLTQVDAYAFKDCKQISIYIGGSSDINVFVNAFNVNPIVYSVFDVHFGQYEVLLINHIPIPGEKIVKTTPTPKPENEIDSFKEPKNSPFELPIKALNIMVIISFPLVVILLGTYFILHYAKLLNPTPPPFYPNNGKTNDVDTNL